jgi:hypothetical protein
MTPKEKAEELVEKFEFYCEGIMEYQKQCALIVVDEIIEIEPYQRKFRLFDKVRFFDQTQYFKEVKHEIEAL